MAQTTILVVEDDAAIRRGLCDALAFAGYAVGECTRGDEAVDRALASSPDLLLLDVLLPGKDGFEILRELRASHPQLPVILLTARGGEEDRVRGLKLGADDYVVKPFSASELLARVEAVLRRSAERPRGLRTLRLATERSTWSWARSHSRSGSVVPSDPSGPAHLMPPYPSSRGGAPMPARVSQATMFVVLTFCFVVAGTQTATAQALCPKSDVRDFSEGFQRAPITITVEADLRSFGGTLPGGTWRMPSSGGLAIDGLALEGVSFTRDAKPELGSSGHTFDVVVDLRASDRVLVDIEFVVVDGERRLRLGAFTGIAIRCEAKSVSQTFSIADRDFVAFFEGGKAPTLRITRTGLVDGC